MKRYSGALAKPFDEPKLGFGAIQSQASSDMARKQTQLKAAEISLKVLVLLNHFGINYDDPHLWERLALALAKKHVRGFQERHKSGAKEKWNIFMKWELKEAVDRKMEGKNSGKGVTWACKVLAKQKRWGTLLANNKKPAEALRHAYYEVCSDIKKAEQPSAPTQK